MKNEPAQTEGTPKSETRACWMVVDDNEHVLQAITNLLAAIANAEIRAFRSAPEALAAFAAAPETFQLVVTDLEMPQMNGLELCQRLHQLAPSLKIVLVTGSALMSHETAEQNGFFGLLHKPFPLDQLHSVLKRAEVSLAN
ncbi:MAG: hypothetical protein JWR19_3107 [Pedosphaera sp.]|nr:hypothetical protein [Pedosphaera sp.]